MKNTQLAKHLRSTLPQTTEQVRAAILAIHEGSTWRAAAIAHGVTESGILKAMQRAGLKKKRSASSQPA